jgi:imidazole glycerol-phosphate synthase subunit HisH
MSAMPRFAVVDYGAGNLVSITQALVAAGADTQLAATPDQLEGSDAIVVPGVGASGPAMRRLRATGMDVAIRSAVAAGAWYLGVCLGMELLFEKSEEDGARMLGMLGGRVVEIPGAPRLPHIGWNQLEPVRLHPVLDGLPALAPAYFVHGYSCAPVDRSVIVAETCHGSRFPSVIARDRVIGVQFHPERSGEDGLRLLRNVVALVAAA